MAKTDSKHIKIEIESANGTLVDTSAYITKLEIDNVEVWRMPPTIWQSFWFYLRRIWRKYFS